MGGGSKNAFDPMSGENLHIRTKYLEGGVKKQVSGAKIHWSFWRGSLKTRDALPKGAVRGQLEP